MASLAEAERIVAEAGTELDGGSTATDAPLPDDVEALRWFPLPAEIIARRHDAASEHRHAVALGGA